MRIIPIQTLIPENKQEQLLEVQVIPPEFHEPEERWPELDYINRESSSRGCWRAKRHPGAL